MWFWICMIKQLSNYLIHILYPQRLDVTLPVNQFVVVCYAIVENGFYQSETRGDVILTEFDKAYPSVHSSNFN